MKKNLIFVGTMLVMLTLSINAVATTVQMKDVVVYLQGAELCQTANISLNKGENEILLEGLSPIINQNSLQVKMSGGNVISSYEYGVDYLGKDLSNQHIAALNDSLKLYQKQLAVIKTDIATNKQILELLGKGIDHSLTVDRLNITSETIEKNLIYYQKRAKKISDDQYSAELQKNEIESKIKNIQNQINQDKTKNGKKAGNLKLHIVAKTSGTAQVEVKYYTPSASWNPVYDLNITNVDSPIIFGMKAYVAQTTGLDWKKVKLTLSTGMPSLSNVAPELSTWYLHQREQVKQYRTYAVAAKCAPMMLSANVESVANDADDLSLESATVEDYVSTSDQPLNKEYTIALPYTIEGNGKKQTIAIKTAEAPNVDYQFIAIPKLDNSAYLTAEISNWNALELLSGKANVTFNGTFYGQTYIDAQSTDEKLKLTIGNDQQIYVKREQLIDYSKSKTVGSNKQVTRAFKITIRNNKSTSAKIHIEEPYPVSTDKSITVELSKETTVATQNDKDKGILSYEFTLSPNEVKEIMVGYTVKYPKDWDITL